MLIELTLKNRPISYSHFTSILYDFECYLFRTVPIVCLSNSFLCFIVSLLTLIWEYFLPVLIGIKLGILDFFLVYHFGHTHTHTHTLTATPQKHHWQRESELENTEVQSGYTVTHGVAWMRCCMKTESTKTSLRSPSKGYYTLSSLRFVGVCSQ